MSCQQRIPGRMGSASQPSTSLPARPAVATSHHRAEDAQPNEAAGQRRPYAPPQLRVASTSSSVDDGRRYPSTAAGRFAESSTRGVGSSLSIQKPRRPPSSTTAGGWEDGPTSSRAVRAPATRPLSSLKGKEKATSYYDSRDLQPRREVDSGWSSLQARDQPRHHSVSSHRQDTAMDLDAATPIPVPVNPAPQLPRLYVSNLPHDVTESEVRQVFSAYGPIVKLILHPLAPPKDGRKTRPPFAFIDYRSFATCDDVIKHLHRSAFPNQAPGAPKCSLRVEYADATKKKARTTNDGDERVSTQPAFTTRPPEARLFFDPTPTPTPTPDRRSTKIESFDSSQAVLPIERHRGTPVSKSGKWKDTVVEPDQPSRKINSSKPSKVLPTKEQTQLQLTKLGAVRPNSIKTTHMSGQFRLNYKSPHRAQFKKSDHEKARRDLQPQFDIVESKLATDAKSLTFFVMWRKHPLDQDRPQHEQQQPPLPYQHRPSPLSPNERAVASRQRPVDASDPTLRPRQPSATSSRSASPQSAMQSGDRHGQAPAQPAPAPLTASATIEAADGVLVDSIPLPENCLRGTEEEMEAAQDVFQAAAARQAWADGKVVLNLRFKGNALLVRYELRVPQTPQEQPERLLEQTDHRVAAPEDVKPDVAGAVGPVASSPAPRVTPARDPVRFPATIEGSVAETQAVEQHVEAFLRIFFDRFDSARALLNDLYAPLASFSVKVVYSPPARIRLQGATTPFAQAYAACAGDGKVYHTPTHIVNASKRLPPCSHDLTKVIYDAREVPELRTHAGRPAPIFLHLQGQFDEFPQHTIRSVYRTFLLVPRDSSIGGAGCPDELHYLIQSDTLVFAHHDPRAPSPILKLPPPAPAPTPDPAPADSFAPIASTTPALSPPANLALRARPPMPAAPSTGVTPTASTSAPAPNSNSTSSTVASSSRSVRAPSPRPLPPPAAPRAEISAPARAPSPSPPAAPRPRAPVQQPRVEPPAEQAAPPIASTSRDASDDDAGDGEVLVLSSSDDDQPVGQPTRRKERANAASLPSSSVIGTESTKKSGKRRAVSPPSRTTAPAAKRRAPPAAAEDDRSESDESSDEDDSDADSADENGQVSDGRGGRRSRTEPEVTMAMVRRMIRKEMRDKEADDARKERKRMKKAASRAKRKADEAESASKRRKEDHSPPSPLSDDLSTPAPPPPPPARALKSGTDARLVITGGSTSLPHGHTGIGNKMRWAVGSGESILGVSVGGDIVEYGLKGAASLTKLHRAVGDTFRVDAVAYSPSKGILVVPFLGGRQDKTVVSPPHQVVLYKRGKDVRGNSAVTASPVDANPHKSGGVTATTVLPGSASDRLRFFTAGEDKTIHLWTRGRSTGTITTDRIVNDHTSMITALDHVPSKDWLISGGKDKRMFAYDIQTQRSVFATVAINSVLDLQACPFDSNLMLARLGTGTDQFQVFDVRTPLSPVLTFGFRLTPTPSNTAPTLGRYYRGEFRGSLYAHPDADTGVKLWDLRNSRGSLAQTNATGSLGLKSQALSGCGKSKVIQTIWRGPEEMVLLEQHHFTSVRIR